MERSTAALRAAQTTPVMPVRSERPDSGIVYSDAVRHPVEPAPYGLLPTHSQRQESGIEHSNAVRFPVEPASYGLLLADSSAARHAARRLLQKENATLG